jgi:ABC-type transport system involved in multi-copper enzyme maturation permease subunit
MSWARVRALIAKEVRDYRHNRNVVLSMAILPLVAVVFPVLSLASLPASAPLGLVHKVVDGATLEFLLVPTVIPSVLAGYAIIGERDQGTLEPLLTTPISASELFLGKLLAALIPTLVVAWGLYALSLVILAVAAPASVVHQLLVVPLVLRQLGLDVLLAGWALVVGLLASNRAGDVRVAQQLAALAALPVLVLVGLITAGAISVSRTEGVELAALLAAADVGGLVLLSRTFDPERLLAGPRSRRRAR